MKSICVSLLLFYALAAAYALQDIVPTSGAPRWIRFSGQLSHPIENQTAIITFAIYQQEFGGNPSWSECQTVTVENNKFTVLLGSSQPDALPLAIFISGEARWIEWQMTGQVVAPRTQLISVPYAMGSANAETFAGHSISEFLLANPSARDAVSKAGAARPSRAQREGRPASANNGIPNMLAKFNGASSTVPSQVFDDGVSVGIGTIAPSAKLEVVGDIKISGTGNAFVFPDGNRLGENDAGGITSKNIEQVRYADRFAQGSPTGGIAEAYADCPATGCKVQLGEDVNITTPQVIKVISGKTLVLDLAGRVLKVSNATGIGLTFTTDNINNRTPMTLLNGSLKCSWSNPNLTGFAWRLFVDVSVENVDVRNCNTPGSLAVLWDFVEDAHMNAVGFRYNASALRVQNSSNQVSFRNVWFDSNVNPVVIQDNGGVTFEDCLVQSNTGPRAIQIITTPGNNATTFRIHKCHFENNGDGTPASRNIFIAPAPSQVVLGISVEDNIFTAGTYGAQGTSFEVAGSQTVLPITFKNNQYNGYTRGKIVIGIPNDSRVTSIAENLAFGDYGYDVGINTHGLTGLSFAPQGASHAFQLFAGWPGDYDGFLQFWETTANSSILNYSSSSSSWTFPKTTVFDASVIFNNAQTIYGYSDQQSTQTWGVDGSSGAGRFDGGVRLGPLGLSINGAMNLVTTAQTGTGNLVMSDGATLTNPHIGNATASSLTLNGETMSTASRIVHSVAIVNPGTARLQSRWTLDKAIIVTRLQFIINGGNNSGCNTVAVLQLTDGVSQVALPLANDVNIFDSGSVTVTFPAGSNLDLKIASASVGCSMSATSGNATVQYRMQ